MTRRPDRNKGGQGETKSMKFPSPLRTPVGAAGLSALFPGLGQAAAGQPRRGAIVAIPVFAVLGAFLLILLLARSSLFGLAVNQSWLTSLLILDMVALIYHLWAVADSYLLAGRERAKEQRRNRQSTTKWGTTAALVVIVTAIVGVHGSVAKVDLDWQHSIYCLTAATPCWVTDTGAVATYSAGPGDVAGVDDSPSPTASGSAASARPLTTFDLSSLPSIQTTTDSENWAADGQLNVLLIGADYEVGTSRTGLRPDTMIVLHVDLTSGKAAMIGVPRNNVCVPLPQGIAENYSKGLNGCSPGTWSGYSSGIASAQLNWLANEAWNNPSHFPDPKDDGWRRGSLATMAAVGTLTGLAMDGYVTINIAGLATLIDDLGGIDITVPTKVYDEPCGQKPAWQSAWYTCAPEGYIGGTPVFHSGYQVPGDSSNVQRMMDDAASSGGLQSITWCLPATTPTAGCHPKAGTTGTDIAFVIKPGTQHMDGLWAVAYARTRKFSPGGDFGRMARQQLVLKAMRSTFDPCTILPKIPGLVQHLGGALNTDLPITSDKDVKQWINLAQHTLGGNIKTIVLDPTTTGESFIGGYPAIDPTSWAKIKDIVKHSLDDVPSATSSGGGGGGGFSC